MRESQQETALRSLFEQVNFHVLIARQRRVPRNSGCADRFGPIDASCRVATRRPTVDDRVTHTATDPDDDLTEKGDAGLALLLDQTDDEEQRHGAHSGCNQ